MRGIPFIEYYLLLKCRQIMVPTLTD